MAHFDNLATVTPLHPHPLKDLQSSHWEEDDPMGDALTRWADYMKAAGRPMSTIELRQYQISRFARDMRRMGIDPWKVTPDDIVRWLGSQGWSPATLRSYRAALRMFYAWGTAVGVCKEDPSRLLPPVQAPNGVPRPCPEEVIAAALRTAETDVRLMIYLAAYAGLRRAEIAAVHTDDIVPDPAGGWALRVKGKGNKTRLVPLRDNLATLLRAMPRGWVFPSTRIPGAHITPHALGKKVSAALGHGYTTHTLRHRFATKAYAVDRDLRAVQELLGHAKPETTAIYTAVPDHAKRRAVELAGAA